MFTGIIEEVSNIKSATAGKLVISARKVIEGAKLGDSINVNGACLTVTALDGESFSVDVMPETQRRTNLGTLRSRDKVNLERPLALGGRFGGHFVQGHVDGTAGILSLSPEAESVIAKFGASPEIMRYVVEKGFIAVDGVSLTVVSREVTSFAVSLVAYTLHNTAFSAKKRGDIVNIEVDILAKYIEQFRKAGNSGITAEFLAEHGFMEPSQQK